MRARTVLYLGYLGACAGRCRRAGRRDGRLRDGTSRTASRNMTDRAHNGLPIVDAFDKSIE